MSESTCKDLMEMQNLLTSIDFLEPLEVAWFGSTHPSERADYGLGLYYGKWEVVGTDIVILMKRSCELIIYRKGGVQYNKGVGIKMPKFISLEEILSDESLDKKNRARLAWLIGQVENYGKV